MNRAELVEHIAQQHSMTRAESGRIVQTLIEAVVTTVRKGGSVVLPGFGSFKLHSRAARNGVNPATGAKIKIAAAKLPKFTPGSTFKAAVDPRGTARKAAAKAAGAAKTAGRPAVKSAARKSAKP